MIFAVCLVSHGTVGKHKATVQAGQIHEKTAGLLQCAIDTKIEELVESRGVLFSGMRPCSPRIRGQLEYSNVQTPPSKHQSLNHILGSRAGSCESNSTITLLSKPQVPSSQQISNVVIGKVILQFLQLFWKEKPAFMRHPTCKKWWSFSA